MSMGVLDKEVSKKQGPVARRLNSAVHFSSKEKPSTQYTGKLLSSLTSDRLYGVGS